jgi:hypothetical protein
MSRAPRVARVTFSITAGGRYAVGHLVNGGKADFRMPDNGSMLEGMKVRAAELSATAKRWQDQADLMAEIVAMTEAAERAK